MEREWYQRAAMAEGDQSETRSTEETAGIADNQYNVFVWSKLPKDVQHKVLYYLLVRELCRARCVSKEWRDFIHRHDFFSVYDAVNASQVPSPVMCYLIKVVQSGSIPIVEWDRRLMTFMVDVLRGRDIFNLDVERGLFVTERDPTTGTWEDTESWVDDWILGDEIADIVTVVASGNHLALTDSSSITVYKRAEDCWRLPPGGACFRMRVEGLLLHTPKLDSSP